MLAGHEQGNHDMSDFLVRNRLTVLVFAAHQVPDHILLPYCLALLLCLATSFDDIHIGFGHLALSVVPLPVLRERCPWQHEVDGGETHVKIVVEVGKGTIESLADFFALKGARRSVDGELGHGRRNVENARLALEVLRSFGKCPCLGGDEVDIGSQGLGRETKLDKLEIVSTISQTYRGIKPNLFLLHELRVRAVIDNISAKDRRCQRAVDLLGIYVFKFPIEDKLIPFRAQTHSGLLAQQHKRKDIAVLLPTFEEELVGINAVCDGTANEGNPVENYRWIRATAANREQLREHIEEHSGGKSGRYGEDGEKVCGLSLQSCRYRVDCGG